MMKSKKILNFLLIFLVCIVIHYISTKYILQIEKTYFVSIYVFTILVLITTLLIIEFLERKYREYLGYFFLIIVTLKLVAAKIFMNSFENWRENEFKFSFLILYLISLILITRFAIKKLMTEKDD
ncbi:MAG: hypothetical protein GX159_11640 [Flavobacteriaceae bacterium]|nr:hypothetical protein [Flavobacteriaceae bacterium]